MVVTQGDVFWADLPEPVGSEPGFRRPVVVVQGDRFNRSGIETVICVVITGNLRLARMPGNVVLQSRASGLPRDSVVNVSQILTVDRTRLLEHAGHLAQREVDRVFRGIDIVLGR